MSTSKTKSATENANGSWSNLERNSNNEDPSSFTLGNITDPVFSMIEDLKEFDGTFWTQ